MGKSKNIAIFGLFIALVYVATSINIPGPTPGSLFHLGNIMAFTIAMVWGKKAGAFSAAFGMGLFDLLSPYAIWAPFTFVIRFAMGYVLGSLANKNDNSKLKRSFYLILALILSTIIMIVGYYIAEVVLYHNMITPLESVFANLMQCVVGTIGAIPLSAALKAGFKARGIKIN